MIFLSMNFPNLLEMYVVVCYTNKKFFYEKKGKNNDKSNSVE